MAQIDPLPRYTMRRNGRMYEVHDASITITKIHLLGYIFHKDEGLIRRTEVTYACLIGASKIEGKAMLYGKYIDTLVSKALLGSWYACSGAFDAGSKGHYALVAVAPQEYGHERSIFAIRT
jgi:hypothetical protein